MTTKSLLIIPPPGDKAIINTLVTIQSFFYIFMFIFFKNEICTVCTLKAFKLSISVMGRMCSYIRKWTVA